MRLSDKQYHAVVRVGILIVLATMFAFERVPSTYQPFVLALAAIGAAFGFFPIVTSRPFHSSEKNESRPVEPEASNRGHALGSEFCERPLDLGATIGTPGSLESTESASYSPHLEYYIRNVYSQFFRHPSVSKNYFQFYNVNSAILGPSIIEAYEALEERSERMREVHDLIDRLRGTAQTFSVELTSSNSIIVQCAGRSEGSTTLDDYERQMREFDGPEDASAKTIQ